MTNATMTAEPAGDRSDHRHEADQLADGPVRLSGAALSILVLSAIALMAGVLAFYANVYSLHHDLAGSLASAQLAQVLGEAFKDYAVFYPPAERAWSGLAVSLKDLIGLRLDLSAMVITNLAVLFSTGLAYHIRRTATGASLGFFIVSLTLLTVLPILFKNVFGLRAHMVVLGLWPYLVLRLSDPSGTRVGWKTRWILGVWLGLTLLLKYIYALAVLLFELADAAMQKRPLALFRVENLISGGLVALYLFVWLGVDPAQREAMGAMVSAIDGNLDSFQSNVTKAVVHSAPAVLFLILGFVFKVPVRLNVLGLALVVAAISASWVQGRWYSHHLFPITMAYFAWVWTLRGHLKPLWQGVLLLFLMGSVVGEIRNSVVLQRSTSELYQSMADAGISVEGKRVGLLTMHPSPFNQYLTTRGAVRWVTAVNNAYVAAELQDFDRPENAGVTPPPVRLQDPGRQMLHDSTLRLWEDQPPDVLILDHSRNWPLRYVNVRWRQVFAEDARFQAVLERYRLVHEYDGQLVDFEYLERID